MNADYRLADPSLYVFSGFSVSEIKSLGNFPDYAKLSGVSLPTAASGFGVDTAMPRPYRPFRWPYFQTMGKFATFQRRGLDSRLYCGLTRSSTTEDGPRLLDRAREYLPRTNSPTTGAGGSARQRHLVFFTRV